MGLFAQRCGDYRATVTRCEDDVASIGRAIADARERQHARAVVVPSDLDRGWLPEGLGVRVDEAQLSVTELDAIDGVVTGCALAIAVTGTIAPDSGPGQGSRWSRICTCAWCAASRAYSAWSMRCGHWAPR
jgi:L-lactate dehydrogenase complex protein LldG